MEVSRSYSSILTWFVFSLYGGAACRGIFAAAFTTGLSTDDDICSTSDIGDGYCDPSQNSALCGYDGGDCCECTCVNGPFFTCGVNLYDCIDPGASCDTSSGTDSSSFCITDGGDGYCDSWLNDETCDYDGGDCCECTCTDTPSFSCGEGSSFFCLDPTADCPSEEVTPAPTTASRTAEPTPAQASSLVATPAPVESTPQPTPAAAVTTGDDEQDDTSETSDAADRGLDDDDTSTADSATSESASGPVPEDDYPNCIGVISRIGDGVCLEVNNNANCDYDGGDCCSCTCSSFSASACNTIYDCQDPDASCFESESTAASTSSSSSSSNTYIYIGVGTGAAALAAILIGICCIRSKRRQATQASPAPTRAAEVIVPVLEATQESTVPVVVAHAAQDASAPPVPDGPPPAYGDFDPNDRNA